MKYKDERKALINLRTQFGYLNRQTKFSNRINKLNAMGQDNRGITDATGIIRLSRAVKAQKEMFRNSFLAQTPYMKWTKRGVYGASAWANITKNVSYFSSFAKITSHFNRKLRVVPRRPKLAKISPEKVYDQIVKNGGICLSLEHNDWVILLENSQVDKELIQECRDSRKFSFDKIAHSFYSRNNHKNIFRKLDYLISTNYKDNKVKLTGGYHDQIIRVKKLLQQDFDNSEVLISTVMTWVEYAISARFGVVNDNNGYRLGGKIQNLDKYISNTSVEKFDNNILAYYTVFSYLSELWNPKMQKFEDGREKIGIGRHSVQHGRVDPNRYLNSKKDSGKNLDKDVIEKLICLVYALVKLPDIEEIKKKIAA